MAKSLKIIPYHYLKIPEIKDSERMSGKTGTGIVTMRTELKNTSVRTKTKKKKERKKSTYYDKYANKIQISSCSVYYIP